MSTTGFFALALSVICFAGHGVTGLSTHPPTTTEEVTTAAPPPANTTTYSYKRLPRDCSDVAKHHTEDGTYVIHPHNAQSFGVVCRFRDGHGWTVLQSNVGHMGWDRAWSHYRNGFGSIEHGQSFWLGLEKIYWLTSQKSRQYILRVDLEDAEGKTYFADYSHFSVGDEENAYFLVYGRYLDGTAGDGLRDYHRNQRFSTPDRDNDPYTYRSCAKEYSSGWWFNQCSYSALNKANIYWNEKSSFYKKATMSVRAVPCESEK